MNAIRMAAAAIALAIGAGAVTYGVVIPASLPYRVGVLLFATGLVATTYLLVRMRGPVRRRGFGVLAAVFVVPLLVGAVLPRVDAHRLTSDVAWRASGSGDVVVTAAGRTYLLGPDHVTVLDAATGDRRWAISLDDVDRDESQRVRPVVSETGVVVVTIGGYHPVRAYAADGTLLWDDPPGTVRTDFHLLAVGAKSTVVASNCDQIRTPCTIIGIGTAGTRRWSRTVHPAQDGIRPQLDRLGAASPQVGIPSTVAVAEVASLSRPARVTTLDPDSGHPVATVPAPSNGVGPGLSSPIMLNHAVLISWRLAHRCRWELYQGNHRVWSRQGKAYCERTDSRRQVVVTPDDGRIYVRRDGADSWFTIDLATGHARQLHEDEGTTFRSGRNEIRPEMLGSQVTVTQAAGRLLVRDAGTGDVLWSHAAPAHREGASHQVCVGHHRVVLAGEYTGHNPLFGPLIGDADPRPGWSTGSTTVQVLDAVDGSELSKATLHGTGYRIHAAPTGAVATRASNSGGTTAYLHRVSAQADLPVPARS